jgi:hypothetical protein
LTERTAARRAACYHAGMRRLILLLTLLPTVASAHVLTLWAQPEAGGLAGHGIYGAQQANDFFQKGGGATFGGEIGAQIFFFGAWIDHLQLTDFKGITGTYTEFMVGCNWDFSLGDGDVRPDGKHEPGKNFGGIGFGVGLGLGTGQQVTPPLDNGQVSDKGFMGEIRISAEHRFNNIMALGLQVPIEYGYMFKNSGAANDKSNQYMSIHAAALVYFQFKLSLK